MNPSVVKQRPDLLCLRQITCYLGWLITVVLYRWLAGWICFLLSGWLSTDYHLCCTEVIIFTCTVRLDVYVCKLTISLICHVCCFFSHFCVCFLPLLNNYRYILLFMKHPDCKNLASLSCLIYLFLFLFLFLPLFNTYCYNILKLFTKHWLTDCKNLASIVTSAVFVFL